MAYAQRAKVLADARGQPAGVIRALGTLGWVAESRGDIRSAIQFSGAAVHVALDAGDLDGATGAYGNLGVGHHLLGDNTGSREEHLLALQYYQQAQDLNRRMGRRSAAALTAANEGQVHIRLGDEVEARRCIRDSLAVGRAAGSVMTIWGVLCEADRRLTRGDTAGGLQLIGLVQRHPACDAPYRAEIERILGRVDLGPEVIAAGTEARVGEDFDAAIDAILQVPGGT